MRQRVMIAMALACNPQILIADEPTTALDVTIQAQILDLLKDHQKKVGMALVLITHDLGVVAEVADEVLVMYAGKVVEQGLSRDVLNSPKMPYTQGLLGSIPSLTDRVGRAKTRNRLEAIPGIVPHLLHLPPGCRFQERCKYVLSSCRESEPLLRDVGVSQSVSHRVRCLRDI
jgi:oligopeptide/dipeptide ABC transporter ATP-binding protein